MQIEISSDKVAVSIRDAVSSSKPSRINHDEASSLTVACDTTVTASINAQEASEKPAFHRALPPKTRIPTPPLFFENRNYQVIIEPIDGHVAEFNHVNPSLRSAVTPLGTGKRLLAGIINFQSEVGLSDFEVIVDGELYLTITVEVFPTKIDYKDDYLALMDDVTQEVFGLAFDFLKRTYSQYQTGSESGNSLAEFFAIVTQIFDDLTQAIDLLLANPHHKLERIHEVVDINKARGYDRRSVSWLSRHPGDARMQNGRIEARRVLTSRKQITYDTRENRFIKQVIRSTEDRLAEFLNRYEQLRRSASPDEITHSIHQMQAKLAHRRTHTILADIPNEYQDMSISLVLSMAPGYRDVLKYNLMLNRVLNINSDLFHMSHKTLWLLYEYWCFIKLNSLLREQFELVSQDVIRIDSSGLTVALVKGTTSRISYRNPLNGDEITLTYNPIRSQLTGNQKPDNVLTLRKWGADSEEAIYEYVFDAKYRIDINYENGQTPGPQVDDINAMHRYRDAIVIEREERYPPYERTMFGAYVLFPYSNEEEYMAHQFYNSIKEVNIGGLPFLPSATKLTFGLLSQLIADSPESAFKRAEESTLPLGIDSRLKTIDWNKRDVLVGALRGKEQLEACVDHRFYHIPASSSILPEESLPIHWIALYESSWQRESTSAIRYVGEVTRCQIVNRNEISELPSTSTKKYYRFTVSHWKELEDPISAIEIGPNPVLLTNKFLLDNAREMPELSIGSDREYQLWLELKHALGIKRFSDLPPTPSFPPNRETTFGFDNLTITLKENALLVARDETIRDTIEIERLSSQPGKTIRRIISLAT